MYKVMIVEDELLIRAGIRSSINWEKNDMYIVSEASNGQIAWESFLQTKPDIVLTDIKMPVLDGLGLIKKIREVNKDTKIIILSCVEDFSLAQEAIKLGVQDYILKLTMTTDEMEQVLTKITRDLKAASTSKRSLNSEPYITNEYIEKKFLGYLLYNLYSAEDFLEFINNCHIDLQPNHLVMVLLKIDQYKNLQNLYQDEQGQLIHFTLLNVINEILNRNHMGLVIKETQARYLIIFHTEETDHEAYLLKLTAIVSEMKQILKDYFNVSATFAFSNIGKDYEALKNLYKQCCICLQYEFFLGTGKNLFYSDMNLNTIEHQVIEKAKLLLSDIEVSPSFRDEVLNSLQQTIYEGKLDEDSIRKLFYNVWITIAHETDISTKEITTNLITFIQECAGCKSYDDILHLFKYNLISLRNDMKKKKLYSREIILAINFIHSNFSKQITLKSISDNVNLSPNYLSNLFKKELHISLFEYLNRYRVDKSIELLLTTTMKTYEVAFAVGFSDESYFSKTFKKYTGKRPLEYKKTDVLPS